MTPVWVQRGQPAFEVVEDYIASGIWGKKRNMLGDTAIASIGSDGSLCGAAMFQNYTPEFGTVEISAAAASPRWLSRKVLWEMFSYAFDQIACQAVVLRCDPAASRVSRIFGAYGFKRHDIPRLRGRDKPEAIYILADDDWRGNGFHKEHK